MDLGHGGAPGAGLWYSTVQSTGPPAVKNVREGSGLRSASRSLPDGSGGLIHRNPQHAQELHPLHRVNPAAAPLDFGDVRLGAPEPVGDFLLRQLALFPPLAEQRPEPDVVGMVLRLGSPPLAYRPLSHAAREPTGLSDSVHRGILFW